MHDKGFSLIEAIVAIGLLSVVVVGLAELFATGSQSVLAARSKTTAITIAERKMEELRALPWPLIAVPGGAEEFVDTEGSTTCPGMSAPCESAAFSCRWSAITAPFSSGVLLIDVRVAPLAPHGGAASLTTARARMTP